MNICTLRHLRAPHRTTVRLENQFWAEIDRHAKTAGRTWQEWAVKELANKPDGTGAASWLRVQCLKQSSKGKR